MALTKAQDLRINADLYEALMDQDDDTQVIDICRRIPKGPLHTVTIHNDTVLHMAIYHKKTDLALKLLNMVSSSDYHKLTWQNNGGNTILHETGTNNRTVKVAEAALRMAPMLLSMTNKEGETALYKAARHGKTKPFKFLHEEVSRAIDGPDLTSTFLRREDKFNILHIAILSKNNWIAYEIAVTYKELIGEQDADGMTPLQLLSTIKTEFHPKGFFKRMMFKLINTDFENEQKMFFSLKKLKREKHACEWAMKIAELLVKEDNSWEMTESWTDRRGSKTHEYGLIKATGEKILHETNHSKAYTPLLLATIHDSTDIVKVILKRYPQAVEHVDINGRNILHLAILHRRYKIIDVVEEMEYPLERLRGKVDKNYNTLLHMVGHKVDELKEDVKDPAQELKYDQRLFKRVEMLCTTIDLVTRNSHQKTASEVFNETNDELRTQAKVWMCENATNCSIVAVLIATVAFTSAYTIPGGSKNGHPVLKDRPTFLIFTFADAISLSSALTSVIIFLHILTSPFQFKDFELYLYEKQLLGLIMLIISVAMMMVAFVATLILTIISESKWTTELTLYGVSVFPVVVFVYLYVQEYKKIGKDLYKVLKKKMEKVLVTFHKIWDYKPQSLYPVTGSVHLTSRSPV